MKRVIEYLVVLACIAAVIFLAVYVNIRLHLLERFAPTLVSRSPDWKTYDNPTFGFSFSYPPTWYVAESSPYNETDGIGSITVKGPEGQVYVAWGSGFGGVCSVREEKILFAGSQVSVCHETNANDTEEWRQISKKMSKGSLNVVAIASNPKDQHRDAVLKILSSFSVN